MRAFSSTSVRPAASCFDRNEATAAYIARMETPSVRRSNWNVTAVADAPPNRVLSAEVAEDEEVQWLWTSAGDGVSYVSAYNIVNRREPEIGA
jgi:hypothetical protein